MRATTMRRLGGRLTWLMAGAAICTTLTIVLALVVQVLDDPLGFTLLVVAGAMLGGLLGLVPGVRELEVSASRTMLGVTSDLVVPEPPNLGHRLRAVLFVQLHLVCGALTAAALVMLLPACTLVLVDLLSGVEGTYWTLPSGTGAQVALGIAVTLGLGAALLLWWPLGALAGRLAVVLLGPTSQDRLAVALARVDQEAARTRIARELHDGIGHALTIVSLQAAAGRRVMAREPETAQGALAQIETTAREALERLDGMLAALREDAPPPTETSAEPQLEALVQEHRRAGMDLRATMQIPDDLLVVQRVHVERIVAELLTNAHRHGAPGVVELRIHQEEDVLDIEVTNPLRTTAPAVVAPCGADDAGDGGGDARAGGVAPRGGGRGLAGQAERLALFGGRLETSQEEGRWIARARLPILREGS